MICSIFLLHGNANWVKILYLYVIQGTNKNYIDLAHIQGVFEFIRQTLRGDGAHHKDSELHRNTCHQMSS